MTPLQHFCDSKPAAPFSKTLNARSRQRLLFPLPKPTPSTFYRSSVKLARGTRQRINSRAVRTADLAKVVDTLNELYTATPSVSPAVTTASSKPTLAPKGVFEHLTACLSHKLPAPLVGAEAHEASRELLGVSPSGYAEATATTVRPYDRSLVSIHSSGSVAPLISNILDPEGQTVVRSFESVMLLNSAEYAFASQQFTPLTPYMDEILASSDDLYYQFVHDLFLANVVDFSNSPRDLVTPFFVEKRGKQKIRLVFDCRVPNRRFRPPPRARMPSGATWSRVRLNGKTTDPDRQKLYCTHWDIADCFYNCGLDPLLADFFCMPPIPSHLLAQWGVPHIQGGRAR